MEDLIESYRNTRRQLKQKEQEMHSGRESGDLDPSKDEDITLVSSMIKGIDYTISLMRRYVSETDGEKVVLRERMDLRYWDPVWIESRAGSYRFEDEVMDRLCPEEKPYPAKIDLRMLPRRQSEAIQMYADGMTYSAVSELMGVEKGTVSKHLQLVRDKLQNGVPLMLDFGD